MSEQIRIVLTVDNAVKKLIEDSANEYCDGNISAYVRGLVVFHQLLRKKGTGHADIPGWMLGMYPLQMIDRLTGSIDKYRAITRGMLDAAQKITPRKPSKK
jgi:hypothetical protein